MVVTVELQIVHERETLELFDIRAGDKVPQLVRQRFHGRNVCSRSLMDSISVGTEQMISTRSMHAHNWLV